MFEDWKRFTKDRAIWSKAQKMALRGCQQERWYLADPRLPFCDQPVPLSQSTKPSQTGFPRLTVEHFVPCRKCERCLFFRMMKWRERAQAEIHAAKRTWFVTLTFAPTHLAGILQEARSRGLEADEAVDRAAYDHCQRFFKRLRKAKLRFRYLAVFELGEKNGRAHYHVLLHEIGERPMLKRTLEAQWRSHVHARLVDPASSRDVAAYATKVTRYTTKSLAVRPRASNLYGQPLKQKGGAGEKPLPRLAKQANVSEFEWRTRDAERETENPTSVLCDPA